VALRVVNVFDSEMEEGPGRDGFWFRAAELGTRIGATRIGATVYEASAGVPIWPYHYHYPDEEWPYVLDGAPVLRDAGGRRDLGPGTSCASRLVIVARTHSRIRAGSCSSLARSRPARSCRSTRTPTRSRCFRGSRPTSSTRCGWCVPARSTTGTARARVPSHRRR
jgi:hypothetical protein